MIRAHVRFQVRVAELRNTSLTSVGSCILIKEPLSALLRMGQQRARGCFLAACGRVDHAGAGWFADDSGTRRGVPNPMCLCVDWFWLKAVHRDVTFGCQLSRHQEDPRTVNSQRTEIIVTHDAEPGVLETNTRRLLDVRS